MRSWRLVTCYWLVTVGCVASRPVASPFPTSSRAATRVLEAAAVAVRAESLATRFAGDRQNAALYTMALATADSALRQDSNVVRGHVARGIAFAAASRPRDAALAYRRALALDPDFPRLANAALGQFWRAGLYDEAYRWAKRQAQREPRNLGVLFNYNVAAGFLIEPARAESLMVRALEIDPRYTTAHGELAFLAMYAGRHSEAVRHMEMAVSIDSTSALNRGGLAQMLVAAGDAARARRLLEPVVSTDSTATAYGGRSLLLIYGWALQQSGDSAAASRVLDRALTQLRRREAAGQTTYQLFREMAAVHALLGDHAAAIAALRRAADAGLHTYASWGLADPMFAAVQRDPQVADIVRRMQADTRRMRARAGLSDVQPTEELQTKWVWSGNSGA